jgi:hypothetical protein
MKLEKNVLNKSISLFFPLFMIVHIFRMTGSFFTNDYLLLISLILINIPFGIEILSKQYKISDYNLKYGLFLLFPVWALITSFWSIFPFDSFTRSIFFITLIFTFINLLKHFKKLFKIIISFNGIIILLLILSLITQFPVDTWTKGNGRGFSSFFVHQNTLAAYLLFSSVPLFYLLFDNVGNGKSKFYWLVLFMNLFFIIISYSRASIMAFAALLVCFVIISYSSGLFHLSKTLPNNLPKNLVSSNLSSTARISILILLLILISLLILIFTISNPFILSIIGKGNPENIFVNRLHLWSASFNAALNGGLFGLGFGVSDQSIFVEYSGSYFIGDKYIREKGIGFLALIEETGLIGFTLFFLPIIYILYSKRNFLLNKIITNKCKASDGIGIS